MIGVLAVLLSPWIAGLEAASTCDQDVRVTYLNGAMYMVAKAKYDLAGKARDCADLLRMGHHESGVYAVWPASRLSDGRSLDVYCDMLTDGGGWTVIQRRGDLGNPTDYFFKDWNSYKKGFGDLKKEFWLGNDNIFALTNQKLYSARFDLKDVDKEDAYAQYGTFWIDDESNKYTLHIAGYKGTAGDSLESYHNNHKFSTKDQDNDNTQKEHCADVYKGAWWYNGCHHSNLNGLYLRRKLKSSPDGVVWLTWRGHSHSLESTEIKIRPKAFKLP